MAGNQIFSANSTSFLNRNTTPITPSPLPTTQTPVMPQCNLIWKDGKEAVLAHPTSPNEILYFGNTGDENIIWVRETDGNGNIKNPLHKLRYVEEDEPFGPEAQFVTKEEHQQLYDLVNSINSKLDEFTQKIEALLK